MKNYVLIDQAINTWKNNSCRGIITVPKYIDKKILLVQCLDRMFGKNKDTSITIIVDKASTSIMMADYIGEYNKYYSMKIEEGYINIRTVNSIENNNAKVVGRTIIWYNADYYSGNIERFLNQFIFHLIIIDANFKNSFIKDAICKYTTVINAFKNSDIEKARDSSPVEETLVNIDIPLNSPDYDKLQKLNEYIAASLNIFGSFETINKCNSGDFKNGMTAMQCCNCLSVENGWHEFLDMSIELNRRIDELYNPIKIKERALLTYNIIRQRSSFLSNYEQKLEKICEIVKNNKNKKILIINKTTEFANNVTEYLNENIGDCCRNYHDAVDKIPAIDKYGNPLYYKTGSKKGERKYFGAEAQKSLAEELFKEGRINVLSTNNKPDTNLSCEIEIVIITSPYCDEIQSYKYRLNKIEFGDIDGVIHLYTIYIKNSPEENLLNKRTLQKNHTIKKESTDKLFEGYHVDD